MGCVSTTTVAAIILTGVRRFNTYGSQCALNDTPYHVDADGNDWTYSDDADKIKKLFIVQCVFVIPLVCCMTCGTMSAFAGSAMDKNSFMYQK